MLKRSDLRIFDTHCDTLSEIFDKGLKLKENNIHIDLKRMSEYGSYTQLFAVYTAPEHKAEALKRNLDVIENFKKELAENSSLLSLCTSYDELKTSGRKINALLSLEGGEAIDSEETLALLYDCGVRCIAYTWNYSNHIAAGVLEPDEARGLTDFGRIIIKKAEELGIIADTSHLNDKSFWELAEITEKPIIASHSNSRAVYRHKRNLTDLQFEEIRRKGGCVGINIYSDFLSDSQNASITDIIKHIEHFAGLGGEENIGLGTDFDGIDRMPAGIRGVQDIYKLFNEMSALGYSDAVLEKIAYKNFERVCKICL